MLIVSRHSHRTGERRRTSRWGDHVTIGFAPTLTSRVGARDGWADDRVRWAPVLRRAVLGDCDDLHGSARPRGGIALINSVGNLGGFFGRPSWVIKDKTGSNVAALVFLGSALLTMAVLTLAVAKSKSSGAPDRNS
jgi:hypothetical protein